MAQERGGGGGKVTSFSTKPKIPTKVTGGTTSTTKTAPSAPLSFGPRGAKNLGQLDSRMQAYSAGRTASAPVGGGSDLGGGGGGGGLQNFGFGGGGDLGGALAPAVAAPSEEDYLAGDSGYQTQLSALQSALQRFLADSDFQRTNYQTDYDRSLKDLGYDEGSKAWNWNDKLTASGRGYQNQLDDFGARGMLQSSGYADAFNELQRALGQQYDSLSRGRSTFMTDLDNQIANYKGENTSNTQAARAEALQRRAAQFGL